MLCVDQIVDNPANWNNEYPLASALYSEAHKNAVLRVTDILTSCRNNTAIYSALKLDNAFDLNELTNFTSQVRLPDGVCLCMWVRVGRVCVCVFFFWGGVLSQTHTH